MTTPSDNGSETEEVWTIIGPDGATEFRGDIWAEMARQEELANSKATDAQRMMGTEGHNFWCRLDHPFLIMGQAWTLEELIDQEKGYYDLNDQESADEWAEHLEGINDRWDRGYRFGRCYSEACQEGELGDTHFSVMVEITEPMFDAAQRCGFDMSRIMALVETNDPGAVAFVTLLIERTINR